MAEVEGGGSRDEGGKGFTQRRQAATVLTTKHTKDTKPDSPRRHGDCWLELCEGLPTPHFLRPKVSVIKLET